MENDNQIKKDILIAEELAKEIYSGKSSTSLLFNDWKKRHTHLYQSILKQDTLKNELTFHSEEDVDAAFQNIKKQIEYPIKYISWKIAGIAASITLIIGISIGLISTSKGDLEQYNGQISTQSNVSTIINETKITTSTSSKFIIKDNLLTSHTENKEETISVVLRDGHSINKLVVPTGGDYHLTLEEGSEIQINAASEILFPTRFNENIRKVYLTGEAFFRVKANKEHPFLVETGPLTIIATGTEFNIRAYPDEENINVSLVTGTVHIKNKGESITTLSPGESFCFSKTSQKYKLEDIDLELVTDWTTDKFIFRDETIGDIMKELSRWYNVKIEVSPEIQEKRYNGILSRKQSLEDILKSLHLTCELKFKMKGNNTIDATK